MPVERRASATGGIFSNAWGGKLMAFERITYNPLQMGGKPCIRGMRVTVGMIIGLLASGQSREDILRAYPYLEPEDIDQAIHFERQHP
jgi:uncharacterized protein (DUF433 family)